MVARELFSPVTQAPRALPSTRTQRSLPLIPLRRSSRTIRKHRDISLSNLCARVARRPRPPKPSCRSSLTPSRGVCLLPRRVARVDERVSRLQKMPSPSLNQGTTAQLQLSCFREQTAASLLCGGRRCDSAAYKASQLVSMSSMNCSCSVVRKGDAREVREQRTELAAMSWLRAPESDL